LINHLNLQEEEEEEEDDITNKEKKIDEAFIMLIK
jgi:hypothetical protein